jgi:hypothetical protein
MSKKVWLMLIGGLGWRDVRRAVWMLRLLGKGVLRGICVEGMVGNATKKSTWHIQ